MAENQLSFIVDKARKFEAELRKRGAIGDGLGQLAREMHERLPFPEEILKAIKQVAHLRNEVMHKRDLSAQEFERFKVCAQQVEQWLFQSGKSASSASGRRAYAAREPASTTRSSNAGQRVAIGAAIGFVILVLASTCSHNSPGQSSNTEPVSAVQLDHDASATPRDATSTSVAHHRAIRLASQHHHVGDESHLEDIRHPEAGSDVNGLAQQPVLSLPPEPLPDLMRSPSFRGASLSSEQQAQFMQVMLRAMMPLPPQDRQVVRAAWPSVLPVLAISACYSGNNVGDFYRNYARPGVDVFANNTRAAPLSWMLPAARTHCLNVKSIGMASWSFVVANQFNLEAVFESSDTGERRSMSYTLVNVDGLWEVGALRLQ